MVIEMKKDATPDDVRIALEQLAAARAEEHGRKQSFGAWKIAVLAAAKAEERKRKRAQSFGAWKTAVDGLDFQQETRDDWN